MKLQISLVTGKRSAGFTIVELMIALLIAGILLGIGLPEMRDFIRNQRLYSSGTDMLHSLQLARSEAIKLQLPAPQSVIACASLNPTAPTPVCSYGSFSGWIVFQDTNGNWQYDAGEQILERHDTLDSTVTVRTDGSGIVSYAGTGFANGLGAPAGLTMSQNTVICDARGTGLISPTSSLSLGRAVTISNTGRTLTTNNYVAVTNALTAIGASCP